MKPTLHKTPEYMNRVATNMRLQQMFPTCCALLYYYSYYYYYYYWLYGRSAQQIAPQAKEPAR